MSNARAVRERLRAHGPSALSAAELLAVLLGKGVRGRAALDVADALLRESGGSLARLAARTPCELEAGRGVGPEVAARLAAALELGRRMGAEAPGRRTRIRGPADVHALCGPVMRALAHEEFHVLLLNTQHEVLRRLAVTRGTLDSSLVHPREVFAAAVTERAAALILVHNHPSGDPAPSADDRAVTRQLTAAGEVLGIPVLDHVIIGDGRYVSLVEVGVDDVARSP